MKSILHMYVCNIHVCINCNCFRIADLEQKNSKLNEKYITSQNLIYICMYVAYYTCNFCI